MLSDSGAIEAGIAALELKMWPNRGQSRFHRGGHRKSGWCGGNSLMTGQPCLNRAAAADGPNRYFRS